MKCLLVLLAFVYAISACGKCERLYWIMPDGTKCEFQYNPAPGHERFEGCEDGRIYVDPAYFSSESEACQK